jgi:hypothetical protein
MTDNPNSTNWQKSVETAISDHSKRISEVEKSLAVYAAVSTEQSHSIQDRFNRMEHTLNTYRIDVTKEIVDTKKDLLDEISPIKSSINKVLWAIGLVILAAATNFVLRGGLNLPL